MILYSGITSNIPITLSSLFLFLYYVFSASTRHLCRPEQRDALLGFKNEFEIGKLSSSCIIAHLKTESWANNSDCCYWDGIKCDDKSGEVMAVHLNCSCLHGQFHSGSKLFRVQSLRTLDLSHNDFVGEIPSSLRNISNLISLDLAHNNLSGEIPSSLGNLFNLIYLDLSHNKFVGEIPSSVGNLSNLENLFLSHNNFGGQIPCSLGNLLHLTYLDLSNNKFIGEIPHCIGNRKSILRWLDVGHNHLVGKLPRSLTRLSTLQFLNVKTNMINDTFPFWLSSLPGLKFLILSSNSFNGPIQKIRFSNELQTIDISHNHFNGTLPDIFFSGNNLRSVNLGHNQLVGKLPRSLASCSSLEVLNIEHNRINDTFRFWLESLQKLQVLVLHSNAFQGSLHELLPKVASWFPELRIIDISYNFFTGTLPYDFFMYWTSMSTERNSSEVRYIGEDSYYKDSLVLMNKGVKLKYRRILTLLTAIDFSENKLQGDIPESIGLLKNLNILNLSSNGFRGNIPSNVANLTLLESLDLSHNKLSGKIPLALRDLTSLSTVRVSHNQLVGPIPQGTQFQTQNASCFEDNLGLCGLPLNNNCGDTDTEKPQEPESEEEKGVLSWTAAAIALAPGVIFGLTIGYFVRLQHPQRLINIVTRIALGIVGEQRSTANSMSHK